MISDLPRVMAARMAVGCKRGLLLFKLWGRNTFFSGTKPAAILSVNLADEYQKGNLQDNLNLAASQCSPKKAI